MTSFRPGHFRDQSKIQDPPKIARPSLLAGTIYAVAGTGFFHACQLGMLMLLARYAAPEVTGEYFFALAVATPVLLLLGLELRGALVADAVGEFSLATYRTTRNALLVPAGLILAGLLAWRAARQPDPMLLTLTAAVFACRLAWSAAEVAWGTYQRRERMDLVAATYALRGVALLLPFAVLLPLWRFRAGAGAGPAAAALTLSAALWVLVYFVFDRPRWRLSLDRSAPRPLGLSTPSAGTWSAVWALIQRTFPLGLVALAVNLCDSFPRWLFETGCVPDGTAQLGYFGALAYVTLVGNLVVIQASAAAANRLARSYPHDLRAFTRVLTRLSLAALAIGGGLLLLAVLAGRWLLGVLYTPDYARFETEFQLIVLANSLALLTNVFGAATTQMRLFWVQVPVQAVTLAATVAAALWLIPGPAPVLGAAQTALVRALVQLVLYSGCVALGLAQARRHAQAAPPNGPESGGPESGGQESGEPESGEPVAGS